MFNIEGDVEVRYFTEKYSIHFLEWCLTNQFVETTIFHGNWSRVVGVHFCYLLSLVCIKA